MKDTRTSAVEADTQVTDTLRASLCEPIDELIQSSVRKTVLKRIEYKAVNQSESSTSVELRKKYFPLNPSKDEESAVSSSDEAESISSSTGFIQEQSKKMKEQRKKLKKQSKKSSSRQSTINHANIIERNVGDKKQTLNPSDSQEIVVKTEIMDSKMFSNQEWRKKCRPLNLSDAQTSTVTHNSFTKEKKPSLNPSGGQELVVKTEVDSKMLSKQEWNKKCDSSTNGNVTVLLAFLN